MGLVAKRYVKKPIEVSAIQCRSSESPMQSADYIKSFIGASVTSVSCIIGATSINGVDCLGFEVSVSGWSGGDFTVMDGEWILLDVNGRPYVVSDDVFMKTYELLEG